MTPRSPSSSGFCAAMSAAASRQELIVPIRLTWIARVSLSSGLAVPSRPTSLAPGAMPAQATRMRAGPNAARTAATAASWLAGSTTSQAAAAPSISAATARARSSSLSRTPTLAPSAARRRAVASPRPEAPPVTSAVCPPMSMVRSRFRSLLHSKPREGCKTPGAVVSRFETWRTE